MGLFEKRFNVFVKRFRRDESAAFDMAALADANRLDLPRLNEFVELRSGEAASPHCATDSQPKNRLDRLTEF
jgi:hypothetical protein